MRPVVRGGRGIRAGPAGQRETKRGTGMLMVRERERQMVTKIQMGMGERETRTSGISDYPQMLVSVFTKLAPITFSATGNNVCINTPARA